MTQESQPSPPSAAFPFNEPLTGRELEVLRLLASGGGPRTVLALVYYATILAVLVGA